jgi:integrase
MRRGELAGLRWVDIDFANARVSPQRPRVVVDYAVQVSEPKTAKGRRALALDPATLTVLREHQVRQAEEKAVIGASYRDSGLVFTWPDGAPIHPDLITRWFEQHSRAAGLPRSGCTTSATATQVRRWRRACRPRSSASGSGTRPSHSPSTPTATSCPAWTPPPPKRWRSSSCGAMERGPRN